MCPYIHAEQINDVTPSILGQPSYRVSKASAENPRNPEDVMIALHHSRHRMAKRRRGFACAESSGKSASVPIGGAYCTALREKN